MQREAGQVMQHEQRWRCQPWRPAVMNALRLNASVDDSACSFKVGVT